MWISKPVNYIALWETTPAPIIACRRMIEMKTHEQLEKELLEIMASPTEEQIMSQMKAYTNSLSDSEMAYATDFLRNQRKAVDTAMSEILRMFRERGSAKRPS